MIVRNMLINTSFIVVSPLHLNKPSNALIQSYELRAHGVFDLKHLYAMMTY
jgi:hypothetical protein